jgi:hypothetical protein
MTAYGIEGNRNLMGVASPRREWGLTTMPIGSRDVMIRKRRACFTLPKRGC